MALDIPPLPPDDGDEDENNEPRPIGVGKDYKAKVTRRARSFGDGDMVKQPTVSEMVDPKYWSGAEWTEARSLRQEERASLQLLMKQMGLVGKNTKLVLGSWDQASASGFREILAWANVSGSDWRDALAEMATSSQEFGSLDTETGGATELPTNTIDVEALAREKGTEVLGVGLSDEQMAQFQADFARMEAPGIAGTATQDDPNPELFAEQRIREFDPVKADARKALKAFEIVAAKFGVPL